MFKSCNYCRHRKKKCEAHPTTTRCAECEHLDLPCEFSIRQPSLKRRKTSQRIASRVSAATSAGAAPITRDDDILQWPSAGTITAVVKDGDCQLSVLLPGACGPGQKIILNHDIPDDPDLSTTDKYWKYVFPLTPFVPGEMIPDDSGTWHPVLQECIELAAGIALHRRPESDLPQRAGRCLAEATQGDMSLPSLAGVLLLLLRVPLEGHVAQHVFDTVRIALASGQLLPSPILAGAVLANISFRFVGSSQPPLDVPEGYLAAFAQSLDHSTFGHHYVRISNLALSCDRLRVAAERDGLGPEAKLAWSCLEYECLFWAVQLPSTLLDVRDDMPASPEAVVIHSLHNIVLLSFYATVLDWEDTLGALLALRPVPGVLHYISALARSLLLCPREMLIHWAFLSDMQAATARILLRLWHSTRFENFRGLLNLWDDAMNRFPELARSVRDEIGPGPWKVEQTDGYSVFWTFRDLRSLHLEDAVPDITTAMARESLPPLSMSSTSHATGTNASLYDCE